MTFLRSLFKEPFVIQCAAIECLLLLAPLDAAECFMPIHKWLASDQDQPRPAALPESTRHKIKYAYHLYKEKLPNNLVVSI